MESYNKLVAFDLDGTLNFTEKYAVLAYQKALEDLHIKGFTVEEIKSRFGAPFKDDVKFFFGKYDQEASDMFVKAILKYWYHYLDSYATTYPYVNEMLENLIKQGYTLAICSNATLNELKHTLSVLKIDHYFTYIQGITEKNDKAHSLRVLIDKSKAEWICMVGDRHYDKIAAKSNNTHFIGCKYGYCQKDEFEKSDHLAENVLDIPRILQTLDSNQVKK